MTNIEASLAHEMDATRDGWRVTNVEPTMRVVPRDLTPFPEPGNRLTGVERAGDAPRRRHTVPQREHILFVCWCAAAFVLSLVLTLAVVHRAVSRAPHLLPGHYVELWAAIAGLSLVLLAFLGGVIVFGRETPWSVVALWPLLGGALVAVGYLFGVSGQMDAGSALCTAPANGSCDTAWGIGALVVGVVAAAVLGVVFTGTFALRRLVIRICR